jgi:multiple sugar transport system substrate-binding protein
VKEAGFETVPRDTAGFLKLCQKLKANGHPVGFALGNASGDGNVWTHWLLWAFGGKMVDEKNNVVINSKETIAALEYGKELYQTFIPGTLSWARSEQQQGVPGRRNQPHGQRHFHLLRRQECDDAGAESDGGRHSACQYAYRAGWPSNRAEPLLQCDVVQHCKYPNAAKEYLRFMWKRSSTNPGSRLPSAT